MIAATPVQCRDCKRKEDFAPAGWMVILATMIRKKVDHPQPFIARPWFMLCESCKIKYHFPEDLEDHSNPEEARRMIDAAEIE